MCARAKVTKIALNLYFDAAVLVIASLGGAAKYWLCRHRAAPASATKQSISLQAQGSAGLGDAEPGG